MLKLIYAQLDQPTPLFLQSSSQSPWFDQNFKNFTYIFIMRDLQKMLIDCNVLIIVNYPHIFVFV